MVVVHHSNMEVEVDINNSMEVAEVLLSNMEGVDISSSTEQVVVVSNMVLEVDIRNNNMVLVVGITSSTEEHQVVGDMRSNIKGKVHHGSLASEAVDPQVAAVGSAGNSRGKAETPLGSSE
jgi:hypothetical protein